MGSQKQTEMFETEFVQRHLAGAMQFGVEDFRANVGVPLEKNLLNCPFGSPLEMAFFAWWEVMGNTRGFSDSLSIWNQREVRIGERAYVVDFEITSRDEQTLNVGRSLGLTVPRVAVELDGHDFHERTKEQVIWRDSRDRALQSSGWRVFHVSGSALNRNPEESVWNLSLEVGSVFWAFRSQVFSVRATGEER